MKPAGRLSPQVMIRQYPDAVPSPAPQTRSEPLPVIVPPVDGRRARGARTRLNVLEALIAVVDEGELRPTATVVASRAGVALRTLYHHFEDVGELRRVALDLQLRRQSELLEPLDPAEDLEVRIHLLARQLRKLFEALAPMRRATVLDELRSPESEAGLQAFRLKRREHVARSFRPEIARRSGESRSLLDALDASTTWESWDYMRTRLARSVGVAERTLVLTLQELLS